VVERGGGLAAEEEAAEGGVVGVGAGGGGGGGWGLEDAAEEVGISGPGGFSGCRSRGGVGGGGGDGGVVGHFFRPRGACVPVPVAGARAGERSEGALGSRAGVLTRTRRTSWQCVFSSSIFYFSFLHFSFFLSLRAPELGVCFGQRADLNGFGRANQFTQTFGYTPVERRTDRFVRIDLSALQIWDADASGRIIYVLPP
jgi:hypothetical protein